MFPFGLNTQIFEIFLDGKRLPGVGWGKRQPRENHSINSLSTLFREVPRDKVSLRIVNQIREAILSGRLRPGDRLPPEGELLNQFGVSKHTLREALRALETMGFLDIRKGAGGGPVVSEVDRETARNSIANFLHFKDVTVRDLSEVRRVLEPYLARMAAEKLSGEQIRRMEGMNRDLGRVVEQGGSVIGGEFEIGFHTILADAVGNPVLSLILDFVTSLLTDVKLRLKPGPEFSRRVLESHQALLEAFRERAADRAAELMLRHVREVEEDLAALCGDRESTGRPTRGEEESEERKEMRP